MAVGSGVVNKTFPRARYQSRRVFEEHDEELEKQKGKSQTLNIMCHFGRFQGKLSWKRDERLCDGGI